MRRPRRGSRCTCGRPSSSCVTSIEGFDERKYGFSSVVDLLRAAGKEGVLRIERDRQGAIRLFPGANLAAKPRAAEAPIDIDETVDVEVPPEAVVEPAEGGRRATPVEAVEAVESKSRRRRRRRRRDRGLR